MRQETYQYLLTFLASDGRYEATTGIAPSFEEAIAAFRAEHIDAVLLTIARSWPF